MSYCCKVKVDLQLMTNHQYEGEVNEIMITSVRIIQYEIAAHPPAKPPSQPGCFYKIY